MSLRSWIADRWPVISSRGCVTCGRVMCSMAARGDVDHKYMRPVTFGEFVSGWLTRKLRGKRPCIWQYNGCHAESGAETPPRMCPRCCRLTARFPEARLITSSISSDKVTPFTSDLDKFHSHYHEMCEGKRPYEPMPAEHTPKDV